MSEIENVDNSHVIKEALGEDTGRRTTTYVYPIKCMNCSLHYIVLSWEHWAEKHTLGGYCPECGIRGNKVVYGPAEQDNFIFEIVPGEAPLHGITPAEQISPFGIGNMALPETE